MWLVFFITLLATVHLHANKDIETRLLQSAKTGDVSRVYLALNQLGTLSSQQHGASINCTNELGQTPLMLATQGGHLEVMLALLDHDADVSLVDQDGNTALLYLAQEKNWYLTWGNWTRYKTAVVTLLNSMNKGNYSAIEALNHKNAAGYSACMWAVQNKEDFLVKELINFGLVTYGTESYQTYILETDNLIAPDGTDLYANTSVAVQSFIATYNTEKASRHYNKDCLLL